MERDERIQHVRGPGSGPTRYYYQRRAQNATNRAGAARARRILESLRPQ